MNEIVESAKYYTFIKDYLPTIQIILIVLFIGLLCLSIYKYINSQGLPDKEFNALSQLSFVSLILLMLILSFLLGVPKAILEEYSNNVLQEEYKDELQSHYSFLKENNNIDEEKSNYFFRKDEESNDYNLTYIIYIKDEKTFVSEDKNIDSTFKEHIKYSVKSNYTIE